MNKKLITKIGCYNIYEIIDLKGNKEYQTDNGKILFSVRFKKYYPNKNYETKNFKTLDGAKKYANKKLKTFVKEKKKVLLKLPKSLYLILIKEEKTNKLFVKVGITSKKFIIRRFSKNYGYDGYTVENILRRIIFEDAELVEKKVKEALNKSKSVKKYRPLLESFSGYSECYDFSGLEKIIEIFDMISQKYINKKNTI